MGRQSLTILGTLRQIAQEVSAANDLPMALSLIVRRVKEAMQVHVCSVYLLDQNTQSIVLRATDGLNPEAVGRVSMQLEEGLVGWVASRGEAINLEYASEHPRYRYFAETGEERYAAFLGAPIVYHKRLLGVLVVQQRERRQFDDSEESFLVTMSAQLAGVIAYAEATGSFPRYEVGMLNNLPEARFKGVVGSTGVAVGRAVVLTPVADLDAVPDRLADDIDEELKVFAAAVQLVRADMAMLADKIIKQMQVPERALFDVYHMMLDDNALTGEVNQLIQQGHWAQGALRHVVERYVTRFELMDDPYLRERASDIKDLGQRLLGRLQESERQHPMVYPDNTVLISEELTPAMLGEVPSDKLVGLVSVQGSSHSHVAILARSMGIPTLMGTVDLPYARVDGLDVIVDGYRGELITRPSERLREYYQALAEQERQLSEELSSQRHLPAITPDGHQVPLWVNTGLLAEMVRAQERGAEGVGLYRSEVPFMIRDRFPTESEQVAIYREQLKVFHPRPVTMRMLDVGGDKSLPYFPIEEDNPFLGWRGIRVTLDHPDIFVRQARAILRANIGLHNVRILLPMISTISEVEEALRLLARARNELQEEGIVVDLPPIGVMIEVPAAVFLTRELARRVDFLSVGSNDLTQYLLAVDRNNPRVAALYDYFHPAVLNALQHIVESAHSEKKSVSICGEMAGDPAVAVLLMAMGFDSLSMNATALPKVKGLLRQVPLAAAQALWGKVREFNNAESISHEVRMALAELGLGAMLNPLALEKAKH